MTATPPSEDTTRKMVTGYGNNQILTSNSTVVNFRTPARSRAREDTDFVFSISRTRTPLGSLTFAQHVRSKRASKPKSYLVNWRDELRDL